MAGLHSTTAPMAIAQSSSGESAPGLQLSLLRMTPVMLAYYKTMQTEGHVVCIILLQHVALSWSRCWL